MDETREELITEVVEKLRDIESEVTCREGELFDGDLCDALRYLDDVRDLLERLNNDEYDIVDYNSDDY